MTLFRPVGVAELALIEELDFRAFPPRLEIQPIFIGSAFGGWLMHSLTPRIPGQPTPKRPSQTFEAGVFGIERGT